MKVRNTRNWLRKARGMVLSAATLFVAPSAFAQAAPTVPLTPSAAPGPPPPAAADVPSPAAPVVPAPAAKPPGPVVVEPVPSAGSEALPAEPQEAAGHKKKKKKKGEKDAAAEAHGAGAAVTTGAGRILLKGRVFALAELQRTQTRVPASLSEMTPSYIDHTTSLDLSLPSARVGLEYEAPLRWISAVAELELTGKPSLKDGFVQARGQHFFARMGQFKLPTSALETESPWNLPQARRGFVHDLLTDWLDVAGRRPGLMVGWRGRGGLRPRFMVGAFQGTTLAGAVGSGNRNTDLIERTSLEAQSYVARAQFEPADIQLGAWYEQRIGSPDAKVTEHYWTAGVDAVIDRVLTSGGIRAWVDGSVGASWYEHVAKAHDDKDATFVAGRALVAYRFGGTVDEAAYVEPFGFIAVLEPDTEVRRDLAFEAAVGVNAGFWQRARLTLQGEINSVQRNFPSGYLGGAEADRMGLLLQAGVAW